MSSVTRKFLRQYTHPPCSVCGQPTRYKNKEWGYKCTNPECRKIRRQM